MRGIDLGARPDPPLKWWPIIGALKFLAGLPRHQYQEEEILIRRVVLLCAASFAVLSLAASAALASYGTIGTNGPSASDLHRGESVTIHCSGFAASAVVTISFHSSPVVLERVKAGKSGSLTATVKVPSEASFGKHTIVAAGRSSNGNTHTDEVSVHVVKSK